MNTDRRPEPNPPPSDGRKWLEEMTRQRNDARAERDQVREELKVARAQYRALTAEREDLVLQLELARGRVVGLERKLALARADINRLRGFKDCAAEGQGRGPVCVQPDRPPDAEGTPGVPAGDSSLGTVQVPVPPPAGS